MNDQPPSDACRDPFEHTLEALISGDASAHDHTILNDTLRCDPEARRIYIRTMAFEAMLAREFAAPEEALAPVRRKRWPTVLAVAATIMLAAILAWRVQPSPEIPTGTADVLMDADIVITHAVITSLDNASGRFDGKALSQGLRLPEGMFELDQGYAEITFDTGAEVTLQGPARLQLESENRTRLASGRASANIPEQARGFIIHTPTSYIRDLGTALAVEVRDDMETDLHVLEGEVEVAATGPGRTTRRKSSASGRPSASPPGKCCPSTSIPTTRDSGAKSDPENPLLRPLVVRFLGRQHHLRIFPRASFETQKRQIRRVSRSHRRHVRTSPALPGKRLLRHLGLPRRRRFASPHRRLLGARATG